MVRPIICMDNTWMLLARSCHKAAFEYFAQDCVMARSEMRLFRLFCIDSEVCKHYIMTIINDSGSCQLALLIRWFQAQAISLNKKPICIQGSVWSLYRS